jgi:hypothetical protein
MTQFSFPWECGATGDQGNVTLEKAFWTNMLLGVSNLEQGGIVYWTESITPPQFDTGVTFAGAVDGLLNPTNPSGGTIRIASGIAVCGGFVYVNDADVDFDCSTSSGSIEDIIVLKMTSSSSEVRLERKSGTAGGPPSLTKSSSVWEIPIARVYFSGNVFTGFKDDREPFGPAGGRIKIYEEILSDFLFISPIGLPAGHPFDILEIEYSGKSALTGTGTAGNNFLMTGGSPLFSTQIVTSSNNTNNAENGNDPPVVFELVRMERSGNPSGSRLSTAILRIINCRDLDNNKRGRYQSEYFDGTDFIAWDGRIIWDKLDKVTNFSLGNGISATAGTRVAVYGVI